MQMATFKAAATNTSPPPVAVEREPVFHHAGDWSDSAVYGHSDWNHEHRRELVSNMRNGHRLRLLHGAHRGRIFTVTATSQADTMKLATALVTVIASSAGSPSGTARELSKCGGDGKRSRRGTEQFACLSLSLAGIHTRGECHPSGILFRQHRQSHLDGIGR